MGHFPPSCNYMNISTLRKCHFLPQKVAYPAPGSGTFWSRKWHFLNKDMAHPQK